MKLQPARRLALIVLMVVMLLFGVVLYGVADYVPDPWRLVAAVAVVVILSTILLPESRKSFGYRRRK